MTAGRCDDSQYSNAIVVCRRGDGEKKLQRTRRNERVQKTRQDEEKKRISFHHGVRRKEGKKPDIIYIPTTPPLPQHRSYRVHCAKREKNHFITGQFAMTGDDAGEEICRRPHERAGDDVENGAATDLSRPATTRWKESRQRQGIGESFRRRGGD